MKQRRQIYFCLFLTMALFPQILLNLFKYNTNPPCAQNLLQILKI